MKGMARISVYMEEKSNETPCLIHVVHYGLPQEGASHRNSRGTMNEVCKEEYDRQGLSVTSVFPIVTLLVPFFGFFRLIQGTFWAIIICGDCYARFFS